MAVAFTGNRRPACRTDGRSDPLALASFFVGALFNELTTGKDDDFVGPAHGGKAMGDEDGHLIFGGLPELVEEFGFGLGIHR